MNNVIWSVQTRENSFNDDLFNGTLQECYDYCELNDIEMGYFGARIAQILVDEEGYFLETLAYEYYR